jgi:hypothetical protein
MKSKIVADGAARSRASEEHQARLRALRAEIEMRHAGEWAQAGFLRRMVLRWRLAAEFRRERKQMEPSPQSLYRSRVTAG